MITPDPCHDRGQPANPMTFTFPARPATPRPIVLDLLEELEQISSQAEAVAQELRRTGLLPRQLEEIQDGASAAAERCVCRLETAASAARGLCG